MYSQMGMFGVGLLRTGGLQNIPSSLEMSPHTNLSIQSAHSDRGTGSKGFNSPRLSKGITTKRPSSP